MWAWQWQLYSQNKVKVFDIDTSKINKINDRISTIADRDIQNFLKEKDLLISASSNFEEVVRDANFIIIATPTNYDELKDSFDTSNVEDGPKINKIKYKIYHSN